MQPVAAGVPMQSAQVVSTMPAAQAKTAVHIAPSAPVLSREDNLSSSRLPHSVTDAAGRLLKSWLEFEAMYYLRISSFTISFDALQEGCLQITPNWSLKPDLQEMVHGMCNVGFTAACKNFELLRMHENIILILL